MFSCFLKPPPLPPAAIHGAAGGAPPSSGARARWLPARPRAGGRPPPAPWRDVAGAAIRRGRGGVADKLAKAKGQRQQILKQVRERAQSEKAAQKKLRPFLLKTVRSLTEGDASDSAAVIEELFKSGWRGSGREYQVLFGILGSRGLWQWAEPLLRKMRWGHDPPEVATYCAAMRTFGQSAEWELSLTALSHLRNRELKPDESCYSALVLALGKAGEWEQALRALQDAYEEGQLRSDHFEHLLIAGKQVVASIDDARGQELELDVASYTTGVAEVGQLADSERVLDVLHDLRSREVFLDSRAYHAAIASCTLAGHQEKLEELLEEAAPGDVESQGKFYDGALSACCGSSNWECALQLLDRHPSKSSDSFSHARRAFVSSGQWQLVLELRQQQDGESPGTAWGLLEELRGEGQGPEPGLEAYDGLLALSARSFQWEQSVALLDAMRSQQLSPTPTSYSTAMSACGKVELWPKAVALLEDLQRQGSPPVDIEVCTAFIRALLPAGEWELAVRFLMAMPTWGLEPDVSAYNAVLRVVERVGEWQWAVRLLEDMKNKGLQPDLDTYNMVISACRKGEQWQRAIHVFYEVKEVGLTPNMLTYGLTIAACKRANEVDWAARLTAELEEWSKENGEAGKQAMARLLEDGVDEEWIDDTGMSEGASEEAAPKILEEEEEEGSGAPGKKRSLVETYEAAADLFRYSVELGSYKPWIGRDLYDLHDMSLDVAKTAVYDMLKERLSKPEGHRDLMTAVTIVVGKGSHSIGDPVLGPGIEEFLKEEFKMKFQMGKEIGRLRIPAAQLQRAKALDLFSTGSS